jgi:CrcB protein
MMQALAVFLGGGMGSLARFGMAKWLGSSEAGFPLGTLAANFLACLVLGFVGGWILQRGHMDNTLKLAIATGFCGGFSTFSTFSLETMKMFEQGKALMALIYIVASLLLCIAGIWLGQSIGKTLA